MNNDKLKEKYKRTKLRDKIKLSSNRVKYNSKNSDDENGNASSYANNVLEDAVSDTSASAKNFTIRRIKDRARNKKLSADITYTPQYVEKGQKYAVNKMRRKASSNQHIATGFIKSIAYGRFYNSSISIRSLLSNSKVLTISLFSAGGIAVISVILVCLIALMTGSPFGVFMSTEDTGTGYTLTSVVQDINAEYLAEIEKIKTDNTHDNFEMEEPVFNWREILAVYSVIISQESDTITFDADKAEVLKDIFWDFADVTYETSTYEETEIQEVTDEYGNTYVTEVPVTKTKLIISVSVKSLHEIEETHEFDDIQKKQLNELLSDDNQNLWLDIENIAYM